LQAADSGAAKGGFGAFGPWTSGNPGLGFFNPRENNWEEFGLPSFSATDDPKFSEGGRRADHSLNAGHRRIPRQAERQSFQEERKHDLIVNLNEASSGIRAAGSGN
jgi:streptogramin lyase